MEIITEVTESQHLSKAMSNSLTQIDCLKCR